VTPEEIRFSQSLPNQCQKSNRCGCQAETRDVQLWASIIGSPSFSSGHQRFADQAGIFLELGVNAAMGARGNVRGRLYPSGRRRKRSPSPGWSKKFKKAWKKVKKAVKRPIKKLGCIRLMRKTIGFDLASSGTVKMGVSLTVSDLNVTDTPEGIHISFLPSFSLVGQIESWELTRVEANKCTERLLGIKLISYCGWLERRARKEIAEKMANLQELKLPAVIRKVEAKLQAKIGKIVSVVVPVPGIL